MDQRWVQGRVARQCRRQWPACGARSRASNGALCSQALGCLLRRFTPGPTCREATGCCRLRPASAPRPPQTCASAARPLRGRGGRGGGVQIGSPCPDSGLPPQDDCNMHRHAAAGLMQPGRPDSAATVSLLRGRRRWLGAASGQATAEAARHLSRGRCDAGESPPHAAHASARPRPSWRCVCIRAAPQQLGPVPPQPKCCWGGAQIAPRLAVNRVSVGNAVPQKTIRLSATESHERRHHFGASSQLPGFDPAAGACCSASAPAQSCPLRPNHAPYAPTMPPYRPSP